MARARGTVQGGRVAGHDEASSARCFDRQRSPRREQETDTLVVTVVGCDHERRDCTQGSHIHPPVQCEQASGVKSCHRSVLSFLWV
jgi:hypothetical protein